MPYAGYQYDAETGLYYLNARMYDSKTARFIQEDTYRGNKTDPLSLNLYTYCANNPLKYEDPTGHNFIKSALSKGAKAVKKVAKAAVKVAKKVAKAAKTVAKKVVSAVKYVVKTVVKYVTKAVKYVANKVQQFWNSPGETVQSVISDAQRALEEKQRALEAKIQAYQQSDTMKFALTATAVDNSMDASEKSSVLDMLGDFVDAKLNDLSGLASSAVDFAVNNKSFMLHTTLDVVGLLPGIGNFADGLNAVVYLLEGDMGNVACSLMACIPLAGVAAVGVKYTGKAADATITFFKNSDKLNGFLDTGKTALKKTGDFFGDFFSKTKPTKETYMYEYYMSLVDDLDVSTKPNSAVFYSGKGNRARAEEFASVNNKTTLEMTPGGKYLDELDLFGENSPLTGSQAADVWGKLSRRYAEEASGNVYGFVSGSSPKSIFNSIEYPTLLKNDKVTNVFTELLR